MGLQELLSREFLRVVEEAAVACARTMGQGDRKHSDAVAVESMRKSMDTLHMRGTVVIGEGERDEAPMLYIGEHVGTWTEQDPEVDIAVDPLEGTNLCATGSANAIAVLAASNKGGLLHAPDCYMEKIIVGPAAKGAVLLNAFGIGPDVVDFVADRSTYKQGRYMPGVHIPIVDPERLLADMPDEVLLLTWNFASEILEQYLNTVYFGHGAYGIQAAAETYFGKPASKLTVLESASLAGVLHAPELYDPIDRPYDNKFRRDYSLQQMAKYGYLDPVTEKKLEAKQCCGTVKTNATERIVAPGQSEYFVDYTRRLLIDRYGEAKVFGGGLQVTTTLDLGLQNAAEAAIAQELPDKRNDPAAALVAIDPANGQILAMAGGRDWAHNKVNFATMVGGSGREAGSAFKAFTLAAAMKAGYNLNAYWNGPSTLAVPGCTDPTQPDGLWHPVNAGDGEAGTFTLAGATAHSVNTIFAQVVAQLGPSNVVDMAHTLGIRSDLPPVCSITLGSVAVNPLEMTNAYATLADHGQRFWATPLLQVKSGGGKIDPSVAPKGDQVIDANDADLVTNALQGVVTGGTGVDAAIPPYPVAGKTGTANENVDAWFCGYTMQIVTCVWMGWPAGEIPLVNVEGVSSVYGGTIPAAIWHDFMSVAMQGKPVIPFTVPSFAGKTVGPSRTVYPSPSPTVNPCAAPSGSGASGQACASPTSTPSPTPTPRASRSPSPSPTASPSTEPSPTPKASASPP
jgi:penicillin-binding protein 1A